MTDWQPIETAPKDGTEILILRNTVNVPIANIAFWADAEEDDGDPHFRPAPAGWWSYSENSVACNLLNGYDEPQFWIPLPPNHYPVCK